MSRAVINIAWKYLPKTFIRVGLIHLLILFFLCRIALKAQSLTGTSGLVSVPTAEIAADGNLILGVNFLNKKYLEYTKYKYHAMAYFVTLGYLPFLEVSIRFTRQSLPQELRKTSVGDRMISLRLKILKEGIFFPAIVLGCHDIGTTISSGDARHFNSLYLVGSKIFHFNSIIKNIGFHLGYGADWMKSNHYQFIGFFGGISIPINSFSDFMLEHDSKYFNCGIKLLFLGKLQLLVSLMDLNGFSGGISYKFIL
ncbi:MAG: YjbH domain-containing protein [Ignavibacteria bacterium]|jgi:hypothetical protein